MENEATSIIKILILYLKPGARIVFNKLYMKLALPMLKRWKVDVVAFGPSLHEEDIYLAISAIKTWQTGSKARMHIMVAMSGSRGPGEAIMSFIENYTTAVIAGNDHLISCLRMINSLSKQDEK